MFKGMPTFWFHADDFRSDPDGSVYLEQNRYKPWPRAKAYESSRPAASKPSSHCRGALPHPVWFKDHPQIVNVKTLGGLLDRQIMENSSATEKHFEENIRPLPSRNRTPAC